MFVLTEEVAQSWQRAVDDYGDFVAVLGLQFIEFHEKADNLRLATDKRVNFARVQVLCMKKDAIVIKLLVLNRLFSDYDERRLNEFMQSLE